MLVYLYGLTTAYAKLEHFLYTASTAEIKSLGTISVTFP